MSAKNNVPAIRAEGLGFSINGHRILSGIDLHIEKNSWIGLIGPNGCGKSTLLKNIYRHFKPTEGAIYINGDNVQGLKSKEAARRMAVLAQENSAEFDFTVRDIVAMGRYAHHSFLQTERDEDEEICLQALKIVGMESFASRSFLNLSGGEKQRVYMAMAFAQQSRILILDEPTNHLDIGYQLHLMDTLRRQKEELGLTIFTSVHDIDLAAAYCDSIIVIKDGDIIARGSPEAILTTDLIRQVFNVDTEITKDTQSSRMRVRYLRYNPIKR